METIIYAHYTALASRCMRGDESACGKLDLLVALTRVVALLDRNFKLNVFPGNTNVLVEDIDPDGTAARLFSSANFSKARLKTTYTAATTLHKSLTRIVAGLEGEISDIKGRL